MLNQIVLAVAATAATLALPLGGAEAASPASIRVQVSDLALDTRDGQARLRGRIADAVDAVCGTPSSVIPGSEQTVGGCRRETEAQALRQTRVRLAGRSNLADAASAR
jgi:UrcA family protein